MLTIECPVCKGEITLGDEEFSEEQLAKSMINWWDLLTTQISIGHKTIYSTMYYGHKKKEDVHMMYKIALWDARTKQEKDTRSAEQ